MDTSALEKYAAFARNALIEGVQGRCYKLALTPVNLAPADADAADGRLFTAAEKEQRRRLLERMAELDDDYEAAYTTLVETVAAAWFNRLVALRYMEAHDFLPSHVRVLSNPEGAFAPQCLKEADTLDLPGLPPQKALELMVAHDDEALLRAVIVAQCEQLAEVLPQVFGGAVRDEALLPDGLLRSDGPVAGMVTSLPDELWQDVEVLGWLYQFYIAERKDEVFAGFKKGKKAGPAELGPATQLFTPDWIVDYMVQNSLGRLWMLNNPASSLADQMPYYVPPEGEVGEFVHIGSPEEITVCDPACGSGHILVAAFRLLVQMYVERGYRASDVPSLILEKNLAGFEIDPRAAQIAELALAMVAREHDRRFLNRGVRPNVRVLETVAFEEGELPTGCSLTANKALLDALEHLNQCGSLLEPSASDLDDLRAAMDACANDLAGEHMREKLGNALTTCEALARRFDCVIANPPYMGSSNFDKWTSAWVKAHYPDAKSDLFSAFMVRIMGLAEPHGEVGMMTPFVWMFIGSYEKLRQKMIDEKTLTSLIQLEYSGFAGATVPICTFTFHNEKLEGVQGGYVRLSDFVGADVQSPKALEAIQNPTCGWFYRADAETFKDIPGTPIAYWASEAMRRAFREGVPLGADLAASSGFTSGDNNKFIRFWWEVGHSNISRSAQGYDDIKKDNCSWVGINNGGGFKRWFAGQDCVVKWKDEAYDMRVSGCAGCSLGSTEHYGEECITWGRITSSKLSMRWSDAGYIPEHASGVFYGNKEKLLYVLAFSGTYISDSFLKILSPTLNFTQGPVGLQPLYEIKNHNIIDITNVLIDISRKDIYINESNRGFCRNPLV